MTFYFNCLNGSFLVWLQTSHDFNIGAAWKRSQTFCAIHLGITQITRKIWKTSVSGSLQDPSIPVNRTALPATWASEARSQAALLPAFQPDTYVHALKNGINRFVKENEKRKEAVGNSKYSNGKGSRNKTIGADALKSKLKSGEIPND